jgi:serine phosphatase RsbU (regulator of sigma subunit)
VLKAVRDFAGGAPQSDDITILTLRHLGPRG